MGLLTMSTSELNRLEVIQRVIERRLTQAAAAISLGLSHRQLKRLVRRYRRDGAAGLVSGKRGKASNHRLPQAFTDEIVAIVRERYADFGPTLACEKLRERHGIVIGRETLRKLMRDAGLWKTRAARRKAGGEEATKHLKMAQRPKTKRLKGVPQALVLSPSAFQP